MGGGLGYSGQNSSAIDTRLTATAGGGIGAQTFNLGSLGIGRQGVPEWMMLLAAAAVVYLVLRK